MSHKSKVIVVGAGIAGMTAAVHLAEKNIEVYLVTNLPLAATSSTSIHSGINVSYDFFKEGDCSQKHFEDTYFFGEDMASPDLVKKMCDIAPDTIQILERLGVMFNRSREGYLKGYSSLGSRYHRQLRAPVSLGHQIGRVLKEQVLYHASQGHIQVYEDWEFLSPILNEQQMCCGVVAQNKRNMEIYVFKADAVIMATGDVGAQSGASVSELYKKGCYLANCEFDEFTPFAILNQDHTFLVPDFLLTKDAKVWIEKNEKPYYFLEDWETLDISNLTHSKILRSFYRLREGLEAINWPNINLDLTKVFQNHDYHDFAQLIKFYSGIDPLQQSVPIKPAKQINLGGLWIDDNHMTNLHGLFAAGDCEFGYHGTQILPGNHLLSLWAAGVFAAKSIQEHIEGLAQTHESISEDVFDQSLKIEQDRFADYMDLSGPENVHYLYDEFQKVLIHNLGPVRENPQIKRAIESLFEINERFQRVSITDKGLCFNEEVFFARQFENQICLAQVMAYSALYRDESRGCHFKPAFPERDDQNYLKTTKVQYEDNKPVISYEEIEGIDFYENLSA